jgi:hypothetical protein
LEEVLKDMLNIADKHCRKQIRQKGNFFRLAKQLEEVLKDMLNIADKHCRKQIRQKGNFGSITLEVIM